MKSFRLTLVIICILSIAVCIAQNTTDINTDTTLPTYQTVDITDSFFTTQSANCTDYVNAYSATAQDQATNTVWNGSLKITTDGQTCTFTSNAVPNHSFNDGRPFPNAFAEQNLSVQVSANPQKAARPTALSLTVNNAIMLNGVKVDVIAAGCFGVGNGRVGCNDMSTPWRYNPISEGSGFRTDSHNAHTQPSGEYHYHGDPVALFDRNANNQASPVIGFAADGFPIFGTFFNNGGTIKKAQSSYKLKAGTRPTGNGSPGGTYDGTFLDDYEYVPNAGDLDACNGMILNGVYGYYVTESYPYILGCYSGTPDASFSKRAGNNQRPIPTTPTPTSPTSPNTPNSDHPNILLVIADDVGLDVLEMYGLTNNPAQTPNISNLAQQGITYQNAWSAPVCTPTRGTILTGKYGFRTNVLAVGQGIGLEEQSLQKLITENVLDAQGNPVYSNTVIGKWHLGNRANGQANNPNLMGVSHYSGLLTGGVQDYNNWQSTTNGQTSESNTYITTELTDRAIDWLDDQNQPWFLWLAYTAPHTPFHLPPANTHTRNTLSGTAADITANPRDYYLAMVEALDYEFGRLLASMDAAERENTVIIFLGDNGTPGRVIDRNIYSRGQAKGSLYQGGIAVPFIVSGKGVTRSSATESMLVHTSDVFTTIASVAGVSNLPAVDGQDFSASFNTANVIGRPYVYSESVDSVGHSWTVRNATHKLIELSDGTQLLYDLLSDPHEKVNLAGQANYQVVQTALNSFVDDLLQGKEVQPFSRGRLQNR